MTKTKSASEFCYNWSQKCEEANLLLSFKGDFNQDLINSILFLTEKRQYINENLTTARSRIFGVLVETMQNICKHGASPGSGEKTKPGIILIGYALNTYSISVGNLVLNNELSQLTSKIDVLKKMNKSELKALHKKVLVSTELSDKSGAGLGFISIARKSDSVEYSVKKLNDKVSFFALEVTIAVK